MRTNSDQPYLNPIDLIKAKRQQVLRLANQRGAAGEVSALSTGNSWIPRPKGSRLRMLLAALSKTGVVIKGSGFDAIVLPSGESLNFDDPEVLDKLLPKMVFVEIKTATQVRVKPDFSGFYFALTESEIAASEALGSRHQVALYNQLTGELMITSIPEILARANPKTGNCLSSYNAMLYLIACEFEGIDVLSSAGEGLLMSNLLGNQQFCSPLITPIIG